MFLAGCLASMVLAAAGLSIALRGQPALAAARVYGLLAATLAATAATATPYLLTH